MEVPVLLPKIFDHPFTYKNNTKKISNLNQGDLVVVPFGKNYNDSIINDSLDFALKKSKSVAFLVVQNDSIRFEKYRTIFC